jgi:type I restriction enzyme S subunit
MAATEMCQVKLKDVCDRITVGHVGPMADKYTPEGIPFLRSQNIAPFRLNVEDIKYVPSEFHEKLRKSALHPGDVAVVRTGYPGTACVIPNTFRELNCADLVVITPSSKLNPYYLAAIFNSAWGMASVAGNLVGVAQQHFNVGAAKELVVSLPARPVQDRIAGILSAYDELIENSQRRIKILESMARALYREWFVHFRFPGHESVPRVPSPLGEIPKGWGMCSLGDFVQFKSGFAFKSGTFTADGEHRLVTIKNVQDGSFNPESDSRMGELPANLPPYCVLTDGEILLSLTGNVGRVCLVYDGPFLLNQRVSKLAPVEAFDWAMTYCMFREPAMRVKLEQLSNGVAQQNLSPVLASKMEFARPPRELRQRFAELAEPMMQVIVQLYSTIQNLRRTRDLLLPRLLSGQIDVEAMAS